ncbi:hypothetical protein [Streptomyces sp. PU_AKi4]|uniref:hypothetical protein n=1 Tax=Streptomyces sp. PU_AKi4 TaxID=2800809 RepID=UPI003524739F
MARPLRDRLTFAAELLEGVGRDKLAAAQALDTDQQTVEASAAQAFLDAAADVRMVTEPGGWSRLRNESADVKAGVASVNLPVFMGADLRQDLEDAAKEIRVPSLSSVAADGLRAAAEGRFVPPRAYTGTGPRRNLNVSVPADVKDRVAGMLDELSKQAGYRVSLASIVTWWLADELGVNMTPTGPVKLVIPLRLREHFEQSAAAQGVTLNQVLEDGLRALLSGEWSYPVAPRAAQGTRLDDTPAKLSLRIDDELRADLQEIAPKLSEKYGRRIHPGTVVIAILKDRFGEPQK